MTVGVNCELIVPVYLMGAVSDRKDEEEEEERE